MNTADIKYQLGHIRSKDDILFLARHAEKDASVFTLIWEFVLSNEQPHAWYASWVLSHATVHHQKDVRKVLPTLYAIVPTQTHPGMKRELFKLILRCKVQEDLCMPLFEKSLIWLQDSKEPFATRANAARFLFEIYKLNPDFKFELGAIFKQQLNNEASLGLTHVLNKAIAEMQV